MSSNNYQILSVGKGETVVDGKSHWKDFIQVHIDDPAEAFRLAMDILRQVEIQQYRGGGCGIAFSLTGTLEPESE